MQGANQRLQALYTWGTLGAPLILSVQLVTAHWLTRDPSVIESALKTPALALMMKKLPLPAPHLACLSPALLRSSRCSLALRHCHPGTAHETPMYIILYTMSTMTDDILELAAHSNDLQVGQQPFKVRNGKLCWLVALD